MPPGLVDERLLRISISMLAPESPSDSQVNGQLVYIRILINDSREERSHHTFSLVDLSITTRLNILSRFPHLMPPALVDKRLLRISISMSAPKLPSDSQVSGQLA